MEETTTNATINQTTEMADSALKVFAKNFLGPSGVASVIAACVGIVFNILNIVVLTHPKMRNSVNLLLTMSAVSQLLLLIVYVPYVIIFNIHFDVHKVPRFHTTNMNEARFLLIYSNISIVAQLSASWLIITTACFRFIFVQFPLKSSKLCSYQRAAIAGASTVAACILVSIPNMMLNAINTVSCHDIQQANPCRDNATTYYVLGYNTQFPLAFMLYNFWQYAVFGKFIPSILLLVFTIFLIRVLLEANRRKKRLHSDAGINRTVQHKEPTHEHTQTARMLLAVVIVFFLIEFPHGLLLVHAALTDESELYDNLGEVIDLSTVIAFSVSLLLYSAMSRQYRKLFIEIFIKKAVNKLRFREFKAKYKKCSCSGVSHNATCVPAKAETCALSVHDVHTVHSVLPSDESLSLVDGEHKHYVNP